MSENRANAVKKFLVSNGISASSIKTIGRGASEPVDPGHNEDAYEKNRRIVINNQPQ